MLSSYLSYTAAITKSKSLYGKLLNKDDYKIMLGMRTVQEVAAYLKKNTFYANMLVPINENDVHREQLEELFKTSLYDDYTKLLHYLGGKKAKFTKAAFLRYEIEDLKVLISTIYTKRESELIESSLVFLKKYSKLDYDKLLHSMSVEELINNLKGTDYYRVLSYFLGNFKEISIFDIEIALDTYFFLTTIKLKDKLLSGSDRKIVTKSFGMEIDILNIMLIYRCKKLFDLPKEITLNYVIPYWYKLSKKQLVNLAACYNVTEFNEILLKTPYAKIFKINEEQMWEINSMNFMYGFYKKMLRESQPSIGMIFLYLHLKDIDIRNIITTIEGVRYSLAAEEIKKYLIGVRM